MQTDNKIEYMLEATDFTGQWKVFLNSIESYISRPKYSDRVTQVINQGLQVYLHFPQAVFATLMILNEDTFEFENKECLPSEKSSESDELYKNLVDKGIVGAALNSGEITMFSVDYSMSIEHNGLIIPLLASWGILGLVILIVEKNPQSYDQMLVKLCSLHGSLFATSFENTLLINNLGKSKEILEQKVSARTMDLAQSKRELNAILDAIHTGILVIDTETDLIVKTNPVAVELINDKEENIIGSKSSDYLDFSDINEDSFGIANYQNFFFRDSLKRASKNFESTLRTSNGKTLSIIRTFSSIVIKNQKYRIESFLDITDRKSSEIALKQANEILELKVQERTQDLQHLIQKLKEQVSEREQAEREVRRMLQKEKELNELKTGFVSMVSHEFRTPLTVIRSAAQIIEKFRNNLSDNEQEDYLRRIIKTVDLMTDLIENVIFIGKADSKIGASKPLTVNLKDFCQGIIKDLHLSLSRQRTINFSFSGENYLAHLDEKMLRLIIINILSNAIKYSSIDKPVEFDLTCEGDKAVFTIRDYGIGIPEHEQDKIFEMFYRADNVGTISGTGLGMAVVMQALQLLKGAIDLQSYVNEGTTFIITIPTVLNTN